jgi:indole-3-glycerol phosphate synthase
LKYIKDILISKKEEIKKMGKNSSFIRSALRKTGRDKRSFFKNIENGKINIIAEIKKASPSRGIINGQLDIKETVITYNKFKSFICGISVLTESLYFKGRPEDIRIAKENSDLPVLRKDFIFSDIQLYQSAALGADCVLLISSLLGRSKLKKLYGLAVSIGLDVLVEIHSLKDLEKALDTGARFIVINNRNLKDMSIDGRTVYNFLDYMQKEDLRDKIFVCESGIEGTGYIKDLFSSGLSTFLIGGYFMASKDLKKTLKNMEFELINKKLI